MDRRPVYQAASEVAERCATVAFDLAGINDLMMLVRDDVAMIGRGVAWCRYESGKDDSYYSHEHVCIDFKNRRDFLHSISRNWRRSDVGRGASYLTRFEARKRFRNYSGDDIKTPSTASTRTVRRLAVLTTVNEQSSGRSGTRVQGVVWVAKGCDKILDEDDPHLDLRSHSRVPNPPTAQRARFAGARA
jgi:hypothetical protein